MLQCENWERSWLDEREESAWGTREGHNFQSERERDGRRSVEE